MRAVARNLLVALGIVALALLALGALPGYLGAGEPYHLTVEPADADGPAVEIGELPDHRYPYLAAALADDDGRSHGYQRGPFGLKEHFTHTPFDEIDGLTERDSDAASDGGVYVTYEGERYYVEIVQVDT